MVSLSCFIDTFACEILSKQGVFFTYQYEQLERFCERARSMELTT